MLVLIERNGTGRRKNSCSPPKRTQRKVNMKNSLDLTEEFYVGDWYVEPELGRLTKNGKTQQLEPKIMRVLVCLAQNNGGVVKKEDFLTNIWEGLHVTQHVLTRTISEIRRVLGDDPQNPRFIQTIPKIGYRMIASISDSNYQRPQATSRNSYPAMPMPTTHLQPSPSFRYFIAGVLTVCVGFAMLFLILIAAHGGGHSN